MNDELLERKLRIIARGEHSNHAHVIVGDVVFLDKDRFKVIGPAKIRHLLEDIYLKSGEEVWTGEHLDIDLKPGEYKYIPQSEWDPYLEEIRRARD